MGWFSKKKSGEKLTSEEAQQYTQWLKEESAKFNESVYWNERLKPELDKALKFLEDKILSGQYLDWQTYQAACSQREAIKNTFLIIEKDLKL